MRASICRARQIPYLNETGPAGAILRGLRLKGAMEKLIAVLLLALLVLPILAGVARMRRLPRRPEDRDGR